jgi:hypothetical protein
MADPRDTVEIEGLRGGDPPPEGSGRAARQFLSIWFRCCNAYGRVYKEADGARYAGRCPRCGAALTVRVGPGGTSQRAFEAW